MNNKKISTVKSLAKEVIDLIDELTIAEKELNEKYNTNYSTSPKHRGALRRRSMDLTRALAEMRKPD